MTATGTQTYLVGGAVRDDLLGLPVEERDWVVVGATPADMLAAGFEAIDADFPVFRHPDTGEEHALARRETKRGPGYRGFTIDAGPDVTLEEDLKRRDLTINAIARDADGGLVDPFGGREDLDAGLLRHVSPAFVEDPLRVLRVARFAAKLGRHGFRVAHGTHRLMRDMVEADAMNELNAERVWRETRRALVTEQPWRFFEVLHICGALTGLLPDLAAAMGAATSHVQTGDSPPVTALRRIAVQTTDPVPRLLAVLWSSLTDRAEAERVVAALRLDRPSARLLRAAAEAHRLCAQAADGDGAALATLALQWFRLPPAQRDELRVACAAQYDDPAALHVLPDLWAAAGRVDAAALSGTGLAGPALGEAIQQRRRAAVEEALQASGLVT